MAKITRRTFLKISQSTLLAGAALTGGSSILLKGAEQALAAVGGTSKASGSSVIPSYCDVCFMACGIKVTVKDGKAVKIEGNPIHPLSRGKLCPRGVGGLGQLYDPDRLKTPLIRTTVNGKQVFRQAGWDEALSYVAEKMKAIIKDSGPESLAILKHGKGAAPFMHLWHAMGSGTEGHPSYAQCRGPRDVGWKLTFGQGVGSPEPVALNKAEVVAFIGGHLGENMHNITLQDYSEGLRNGASHIVVDPRFSTAAGKAKYWLPIRPGTDLALLLAWIHVLIYENLYHFAYMRKNAIGLEELKTHVREMTPEWASLYTGIQADDIRATARELGKASPKSLVFPGRRSNWYGDDTQRSRAMAILNALLGSWGNDSGIFSTDKFKIPKYDNYPKPHQKPVNALDSKAKYPFAESTPVQDIIKASIPGEYDPGKNALVRGWLVYGTNLPMCIPNPALIEKAAQSLDLLTVVETMPAEITGYADVVLPDTTYLERYDNLSNPAWREPFVAIRQPVVPPLYDSKPSWWIAKKLADKMGLVHFFPYKDYSEVIDYQLRKIGSSIKDINKKEGVLTRDYNKPKIKFKTPSGKIEIYSQLMKDNGFEPLPSFTQHAEPPDGYFRLLYGRAPQHTFSRTVNNRILGELYPENEVWVNRRIARMFKLKHGKYVTLINQRGVKSNSIKVRVTERIRQDCVYMVHGFGRRDERMKRAYNIGADDNGLLTDYVVDPIMGATGSQVNFVTFAEQGV